MLCWNCGKEVPEGATLCRHCEADLREEGPEVSPEALQKVLNEALTDEDRRLLGEALVQAETGEEFIASVMVGQCPRCGSSNVDDCENDRAINDICVGQCFDCDFLWCLECGEPLHRDSPHCPHWSVCEQCEEGQKEFGCETPPWECEKIEAWKRGRHGPRQEAVVVDGLAVPDSPFAQEVGFGQAS